MEDEFPEIRDGEKRTPYLYYRRCPKTRIIFPTRVNCRKCSMSASGRSDGRFLSCARRGLSTPAVSAEARLSGTRRRWSGGGLIMSGKFLDGACIASISIADKDGQERTDFLPWGITGELEIKAAWAGAWLFTISVKGSGEIPKTLSSRLRITGLNGFSAICMRI